MALTTPKKILIFFLQNSKDCVKESHLIVSVNNENNALLSVCQNKIPKVEFLSRDN